MAGRAKKQTDLEKTLDTAAAELMRRAMDGVVALQDFTGAFKACTAYLAVKNKISPPVDEEEGKFGGHAEAVRGTGADRGGRNKATRNNGTTAEPDF